MTKDKRAGLFILALLMVVGLFSLTGAIIWHGLTRSPRETINPSPPNSSNSPIPTNDVSTIKRSLDEVQLISFRGVDYSKLRDDLRQKDWRAADRETYLRMLDAAGPGAQEKGMTPQDEMNTLSCGDLRTIDQLWSAASDGQQGFTIQMSILKGLGNDYRKLYDKVGWQKLPPSNEWLFEWTYNPKTRRMEFVPGKEPNYVNPPPGHLPTVEIGYNFDVALSGALKRCDF